MRTTYNDMTTKGRMRGGPMLGLPCCRLPFVRLQLQMTLVNVQRCKVVYNDVLEVQQVAEGVGLQCDDG